MKEALPHLLTALRLLNEYPDYRFTVDQIAYIKPFLERYPEHAASVRKYVAEKRLEIVGCTEVMSDDNLPSGESFVRQLLYGEAYCREALGTDPKVSWMIDTFGHHAQMPQILRQAGFRSFWFYRGVENAESAPTHSLWQGLDGSTIHAIKVPEFVYG